MESSDQRSSPADVVAEAGHVDDTLVSYARKQNFVCRAKTRPCITAKSGRGRRVIMLTSVIKLHHFSADVAFRFGMYTSFSRKFLVFRGGFIISGYKSEIV